MFTLQACFILADYVYKPVIDTRIVFLLTCFGAWQGGLVGISTENKKLLRFHDEIEAGKFLVLVYAHQAEEEKLYAMMSRLHPEAQLVGLDPLFYNPFCSPKLV